MKLGYHCKNSLYKYAQTISNINTEWSDVRKKNRSEQCLRKKEGHNEVKLFTSFPCLSYQGKIERYKDKWTGKINHE